MSPAVVGQQAQEDFASEAITTVTSPALMPTPAPRSTLPSTPHGTCVNCGRDVTLQRVATVATHHTYQWVPHDEPARPGRRCSEAAIPAYHWADGAAAAVYRVST